MISVIKQYGCKSISKYQINTRRGEKIMGPGDGETGRQRDWMKR
jgi:hypothetical protein